jgi:FkbM family methyltransferase
MLVGKSFFNKTNEGVIIMVELNKGLGFPIVSHHVGGRGGTRYLPLMGVFEKDIISVLYEADESTIDDMKDTLRNTTANTIVLADCLSGCSGSRDFNIYSNRYLSSLYKYFASNKEGYYFDEQFGWDNDPLSSSLVEKVTLQTITLDEVMERERGEILPPDFLSLNTQGSELEIIKGGEKTITENVLAIKMEVSFISIYENQPSFSDIELYLKHKNFELASLEVMTPNYISNRTPIGLRGKGFIKQGDALFVRKINSMESFPNKNLSLLKQAFIAFYFSYFDRTYEILSSLPDEIVSEFINHDDVNDNLYLRFLEGVMASIPKNYGPIFPVNYSDIINPDEGKMRWNKSWASKNLDTNRIKSSYYAGLGEKATLKALKILEVDEDYGIELIAKIFGLDAQADELKRQRLEQIRNVRKWTNLG